MLVLFVLLSETTTLYELENRRLYGHYRGAQEALEHASVAERLRIARDLHDTLLQSFQATLPRFQTAVELLPARPDAAKTMLVDTIDQAAQAISEARDAVQGLRTPIDETNDLAAAILTLGNNLVLEQSGTTLPSLRVDVFGMAREIHPNVREELLRIAWEALRNACHHAAAKHFAVELRYDEREFSLRVRDDGKGIDPAVLRAGGREGHFGMRGMTERAKLIEGKLTVWRDLDRGTEVEVRTGAARAYDAPHPQPREASTTLSGLTGMPLHT